MVFYQSSSSIDNLATLSAEDKFKIQTNRGDGIKIVGRFSIRAVRTETNLLEIERRIRMENEAYPLEGSTSSQQGKSRRGSRGTLRNIVLKLLPPCQLKTKWKRKKELSKSPAYILPSNIPDNEIKTNNCSIGSEDHVSYDEVIPVEDRPTKTSLNNTTFTKNSSSTSGYCSTSSNNSHSSNYYFKAFSDGEVSIMDEWFENQHQQDKNKLKICIKKATYSINAAVKESLSSLSKNNTILINNVIMNAQTDEDKLITNISKMVQENMKQLESNVKLILEDKHKDTMEMLQNYRLKMNETSDNLYSNPMLTNTNEKISGKNGE